MENTYTKFSIVTAAKNEACSLQSLFNSISLLEYPFDSFELIIVDDNSDDNTSELLNQLQCDNAFSVKVIRASDKRFPAKKGALDLGIKAAQYDFIIITDADCQPSPKWLSVYNEFFRKGYDFLFGPAPFFMDGTIVNSISCFENLRSTILTSFAASAGVPYSASARNFGFRKSSFLKAGGYENTTETLSGDDDLLIREAVKHKMKIAYVDRKEAAVYSYTKKTFYEYIIQKKRHTKTSLHYLPLNQFLLGFWHLLNLFLLFAPFIFFGKLTGLSLFLIKIIADILTVKATEHKLNYIFNIIALPVLQIIYELFIILNFTNALIGKDEWK